MASSLIALAFLASLISAGAQLNPNFYDAVCPKALSTIRMVVEEAIAEEPRMGASLLRLHFHDCFVNGCDGSILLDDTPAFTGEKTAKPNKNSLRGFEVVDRIKAAVDSACNGSLVSCADILAVAARDSVVALGGPSYRVQLGRRDSTTASTADAVSNMPSSTSDFPALLSNFLSHGLSLADLVVLSGAHTLGFARCASFKARLYNETGAVDGRLAGSLKARCPPRGGNNRLAPLDGSPAAFDTAYFGGLMGKKGLLHSDQQLFKGDGGGSDGLVKYYSENPKAFVDDFGASMVRMGNMRPITGSNGEVRINCRKVN
ncbi:peroxidase P7 [Canna indica]|uniref:Peroxidase n=1 Tax=Canna indica TaxID=4628 RepID=A0AAQ3JTM8_9LILI|nr:peroxidase P7 [Canna indica]